MNFRILLSILIALAVAASLAAQTKFSGTVQCGKADPAYTIPVGDRPDHAFMIGKAKCTFPKPWEIAGTQAKEQEFALFMEISGARARSRTAGVTTFANGDKNYYTCQGSSTLKEGVTQSAEATCTATGGTGKLKGIKGKATVKSKGAPDGTVTHEVEGECQLP